MCSPCSWTPASHSNRNPAAMGGVIMPEIFHPCATRTCQYVSLIQNSPRKISPLPLGPPVCQEKPLHWMPRPKHFAFTLLPLMSCSIRGFRYCAATAGVLQAQFMPPLDLKVQGSLSYLWVKDYSCCFIGGEQAQTNYMSHQRHTRKRCGTAGARPACSSISASMLRKEVSAQ